MNHPQSKTVWSKRWRIFPWVEFYPGETTLAWALAFLAVSAALLHFVMFWLLAGLTAPVAILLMVRGIGASRGAGGMTGRHWSGAGLLFIGMVALSVASYAAAAFSYGWALESMGHLHALSNQTLFGIGMALWCAMGAVIAAMLVPRGLSIWTDWPAQRIQVWRRIFLAFPLITILVHQSLAALGGPLTA